MKKLIFLALLCLTFAAAHAANIQNRTKCTITVTPVCYDPVTCTSTPCGPAIVLPPLSLAALPVCPCPIPFLQGYTVCWGDPGCAGICMNVSDAAGGPCANFPLGTVLPPCPVCPGATGMINWNAMGDLVVR